MTRQYENSRIPEIGCRNRRGMMQERRGEFEFEVESKW